MTWIFRGSMHFGNDQPSVKGNKSLCKQTHTSQTSCTSGGFVISSSNPSLYVLYDHIKNLRILWYHLGTINKNIKLLKQYLVSLSYKKASILNRPNATIID